MGGNLAITLILENGKTYKMDRWTNSFPNFVNHMKFIEKDPNHIAEYLHSWLEMKEDWEKNGPNGPFEFNMTDVYFPHFEMAPTEYGLVVIDMKKNKIYSQQGYSSPGKSYRNLRKKQMIDHAAFYDDYDKEELERLQKLEDDGRIDVTHDFGDGFQNISIDLSPFEVKIFSEDKESAMEYMNLLEKEYGLNEKEKEIWMEFIHRRFKDE